MNVIIQFICLQLVVTAVILCVLWGCLCSELMAEALRSLERAAPDGTVRDVTVIVASVLSSGEESRLRQALKKAYPSAGLTVAVESALRAGCVIRAGEQLWDLSLLTRMKHLWGQGDA